MQMPDFDLLAIRRILDSGAPVPPWLVRGLVERAEWEQERAESDLADLRRLQGAYDRARRRWCWPRKAR
jgi:hypothetical protein